MNGNDFAFARAQTLRRPRDETRPLDAVGRSDWWQLQNKLGRYHPARMAPPTVARRPDGVNIGMLAAISEATHWEKTAKRMLWAEMHPLRMELRDAVAEMIRDLRAFSDGLSSDVR